MNDNTSTEMSDRARRLIEEFEESGQSEAIGVAEILNTIAENGDDSATDETLASCAQEIIFWAAQFVREMGGTPELQ